MLVLVASTTRQFYQSRTQIAQLDQESRSLRAVQSIGQELEGCYDVIQTTPDLVISARDRGDTSRLPENYPDPAPALTPAWDPAPGLSQLRFFHDGVNQELWREVTFSDGRVARQRLAESIYGFTCSNTSAYDFTLSLSFQGNRGLESLQTRVRRADD
jgi:hypothetical protein